MPEADPAVFKDVTVEVEHTSIEASTLMHGRWQQAGIDQTDPEGDSAWQRDSLRQAADAAIAGNYDPAIRQTLADSHTLIDYLWFGDSTTPRPDTLVSGSGMYGGEVILALNPDRISMHDLKASITVMRRHGLETLQAHRHQLLETQGERLLMPLIRAFVSNTPAYRLLESFIGDIDERSERPLEPFLRAVREQQAEQAIRRRYGMEPTEPFSMHPNARASIGRAIARIDHETAPRITLVKEKLTPAQVAKNFLWSTAEAELSGPADDYTGGAIIGSELRSMSPRDTRVFIQTDETGMWHATSNFATWAISQQGLELPTLALSRQVNENILVDLAARALDPDGVPGTYQELLGSFVADYSRTIYQGLEQFSQLEFGYVLSNFTRLATALYRPARADRELGIGITTTREDAFMASDAGRMLTRAELKKALKGTLAKVVKRPAGDHEARLIYISAVGQAALDESAAQHGGVLPPLHEADLILSMQGSLMHQPASIPALRGYTLFTGDIETRTYGYRATPEADPYTTCTVPITPEGRQSLAEQYNNIGLHDLAARITDTDNLTVEGLRQLITDTGRYYAGKQGRAFKEPKTIEGFASLVQGGQLAMQCVGWSQFMQASLVHIFGQNSAKTDSGKVMQKFGTRISQLGHAQTRFIDPVTRRVYMLDATPASWNILHIKDALNANWDALRRGIGNLLTRQTVTVMPPVLPEPKPPVPRQQQTSEAIRGASLKSNTEALLTNLRMIFGRNGQLISHNELFDTVAARGESDLLFRSVATVRATEREDATALAEVEQLLGYLKKLETCSDISILHNLDPHKYVQHPWLLNAITSTLEEAARILQPAGTTQGR